MTDSHPDDTTLLLHAALDGELDAAGMLAVEAKLAADPELAAEYRRLVTLRDAIRTRLPQARASEAFRARIVAMAEPSIRPISTSPRRRWMPDARFGSLAATLMLGVLLGAGAYDRIAAPAPDDDEQRAIVAGYIRGRLSGQPVDVVTSDRHTVKPWLAGKVAGATTIVDLKADNFPLVGGRVDIVGTTPVPTLIYQRREHQIALTELLTVGSPTDARSAKRDGYSLLEWTDGGHRYIAVSDLPPGELDAFGAAFRRAAAVESEQAPKL